MQIKDSAPHHRSLSLTSTETLDSAYVLAYLLREGHPLMEAERIASEMFDVIEGVALEQRLAA